MGHHMGHHAGKFWKVREPHSERQIWMKPRFTPSVKMAATQVYLVCEDYNNNPSLKDPSCFLPIFTLVPLDTCVLALKAILVFFI